MPAQTGNQDLFNTLAKDQNAVKAFNEAKKKEVRHDTGGSLPPGIENGKARLVEIKLDTHKDGDNKGKIFFFLRGVVLEPTEVQGGNASFIVPLYDGKPGPNQKTRSQRIDEMLNYVKLLGVETDGVSLQQMGSIFTALTKSAPIFTFRTWAGKPTKEYPNPRTQTVLKGLATGGGELPDPGANDVEDNTGSEGGEEVDWGQLGTDADNDEADNQAEAQNQIKEACLALGMEEELIDKAENWSSLAEIAATGVVPDSEGSNEEAEAWKPAKDDVVLYKPKGARKSAECQVVQVFKTTLNLKNLETNQVYKSVSYTESPPTIDGKAVEFPK